MGLSLSHGCVRDPNWKKILPPGLVPEWYPGLSALSSSGVRSPYKQITQQKKKKKNWKKIFNLWTSWLVEFCLEHCTPLFGGSLIHLPSIVFRAYLRTFWHFMPQNCLHQRIVNSIILKIFTIVLQFSSLSPLSHYFSSLLSFPSLFLHLLFPLFRAKHHSPPNINITHLSGSFFLVGYDLEGSVVAFFFGRGWWRGLVVVVVFGVGHCGGCGFFFFLAVTDA